MGVWGRRKVVWELTYAVWGGHQVLLHLTEGWEPFQIQELRELDGIGLPVVYVWFRRRVEAQAGAEQTKET